MLFSFSKLGVLPTSENYSHYLLTEYAIRPYNMLYILMDVVSLSSKEIPLLQLLQRCCLSSERAPVPLLNFLCQLDWPQIAQIKQLLLGVSVKMSLDKIST